MNEALIKFESIPQEPSQYNSPSPYFQLLQALRCNPERWEEILRCAERMGILNSCYRALEERCKTLEGQCEVLMRLVRHVCCSANINYSKITIDEVSDDSQVNLDQVVPNFGPNFVNAFPVPPGKSIRLQHLPRPGWTPTDIRIDMSLAGGAVNYLDFSIQFYLGGGDTQLGKPVGPVYSGNAYLNKDGTQIRQSFPKYKGEPIDVGSLERLAVVITNKSAGVNLDSAQVVVLFDNNRFYEMCRTEVCKPGCNPGCSPGCG